MKPYPAYKESGIAWVDQIPSHWESKRMKFIADLKSGDGITSDSINSEGEYPVYGGNGLRGYTASYSHEGDYVLIGRQGALCGNINYATGKFWASEHAVVATLNENHAVYWFGELLRVMNLNQYSQAAAQPGLAVDVIKNLLIPCPPVEEQQAIADYLDRKTAVIDSLIAKKERQIGLLQEQKTAVINHAVTKGLNPHAPLKNSGIPWLGQIPSHWKEKRLKFLTTFVTSGSRGWAQYYSDEGALFIRVGNLSAQNGIKIDLSDCQHVSPPKGSEGQRTQISQNDVLIAITGATIGSVGIVCDDLGEAYVNQHVALSRPILNQVDPRWLGYCIFSEIGQTQIEQLTTGGTKEGLGLDDIRNFIIPLPDLDEQRKNIAWLENKISKINTATKSTQREIELLREYRTAVISAAVTGKIDVRQAPITHTVAG